MCHFSLASTINQEIGKLSDYSSGISGGALLPSLGEILPNKNVVDVFRANSMVCAKLDSECDVQEISGLEYSNNKRMRSEDAAWKCFESHEERSTSTLEGDSVSLTKIRRVAITGAPLYSVIA